MNGLGLIVLLAVAIATFWLASNHQRKQELRVDKAWREAAKALEGVFRPASGSWINPLPRAIIAEIERKSITIDHYTVGGGKNQQTYTRAVTTARAPGDFKLKLIPSHLFSGLARAMGFQDVPVGDRGFDDAFTVKSSDPEAAALWVNAAVRKRIWPVAHATFTVERGKVSAVMGRMLEQPEQLIALAHAAVALSDGRQRVMKVWRKLAKRYGGKVTSVKERWAKMDLEIEGVPIAIDTKKIGDDHYTFVRAAVLGGRLEPFVIANDPHLWQSTLPKAEHDGVPQGYELWTQVPEEARRRLDERVCGLIEEVAPAKVEAREEHVQVTMDGVSLSTNEIERAIALAMALATTPGQGPYR